MSFLMLVKKADRDLIAFLINFFGKVFVARANDFPLLHDVNDVGNKIFKNTFVVRNN